VTKFPEASLETLQISDADALLGIKKLAVTAKSEITKIRYIILLSQGLTTDAVEK
jgi:hypothetical protein